MTSRASTDPHTVTAPSGSRRPALRPGRGAAATPGRTSPLFCTEAEAAQLWSLSEGGISLARARGEMDGTFEQVGRRVLYSTLAPRLHALGLRTPADLGAFCKGAGIRDLAGLLRFLSGDVDGGT